MKREEQILEDYRQSDHSKKENFWFMYRELRPAFDEMDEVFPFNGNEDETERMMHGPGAH